MSEMIKPSTSLKPRSSGFSLIEILVVIGIIVIVLSIAIPTVSKVRTSARVAAVQAQLNGLQGAIERYQQDHSALPGPLSNDALRRNGLAAFPSPTAPDATYVNGLNGTNGVEQITAAENLVLGLLGGLVLQGTPATPIYDPAQVGSGPSNLNPGQLKKFPAYLEATNLSWRNREADGLKTGDYLDNAGDAADSIIPEFVDSFPSPMPILYLRAKRGTAQASPPFNADNNSVITDVPIPTATVPRGHYDFSQFSGYVSADAGGNYIGEGKDISIGDYKPNAPAKPNQLRHGLSLPDLTKVMDKGDTTNYQYPYNSYIYLKNPSSSTTDPQPRQKDGYILISAGADRVYGTPDDITSFGAVNE